MRQESVKNPIVKEESRFNLAFIVLAFALLASLAFFATGNLVANADGAKLQHGEADSEVSASTTLREEMYRIYNPWTGEHLYTSDVEERDSNVKLGWKDEGIEWIAPKQTKTTNYKPVYRLYNPYVDGGDHHYTTNEEEYNSLPAAGWKQEGVAWYSAEEKESGAVKLLRQYNPFAETGTHNYTKDQKEQDSLVSLGWKAEGVGWYGYDSLYVSIENMTATVSTVGTTYTGKQLTPAVTIKGLTAGTDYTVTYGTNINAGKNAGTATIKGKGAYTGTLTVKFDIQKANPTVTVPDGLIGVQHKALNTVTIPAAKNGTFAWKNPAISMEEQGKQTFDATFTPKDANNYNPASAKISVYVKGFFTVSFDVRGGSEIEDQLIFEGEVATRPETDPTRENWKFAGWYAGTECSEGSEFDFTKTTISEDTTVYAKWLPIVRFDVQGRGNEVADCVADGKGKIADPTAQAGSSKGLYIEGWYKDAKCSADKKWDFKDGLLTEPTTLYANWEASADEEGDLNAYWIAPASKMTTGNTKVWTSADPEGADVNVPNENYVKETANVKKSADEIENDVAILLAGESESNPRYKEVYAEYESFMRNDDYHLYTVWNGDKSDSSTEEENAENGFVEFRIIEVGMHEAETEGANALTFQATHLLPQAAKMNSTNSNTDGWKNSALQTSLNTYEKGNIFYSFNVGFIGKIAQLKKKSTDGATKTSVTSEPLNDRLWLPSRTEISGLKGATTDTTGYSLEGSQYAYYKQIGITEAAGAANPALQMTTRAGNKAKTGAVTSTTKWWQRSPLTTSNSDFLAVSDKGLVTGTSSSAEKTCAVVPAFSFGGRLVKFDNQGHGNAIDSQFLSYGETTAKEPTQEQRGTVDGLTFDGWYTDAKCSTGKKFDFSTEVTEPLTLYANWTAAEDESYWLAPAYKMTTANEASKVNVVNTNYVSERCNVKKTSEEIQKDVTKIKEGDAATIAEYTSYMKNDNYHLFTKWNGSTKDGVTDDSLNGYVEFRIIQVGPMKRGTTYPNNEALTFQATHTLPQAQQFANSTSNKAGTQWTSTLLYQALNNNSGDVLKNFNDGFRTDLLTVKKISNLGIESERSYNQQMNMWILSTHEMTGNDEDEEWWEDYGDGYYEWKSWDDGDDQYAYFAGLGTINDVALCNVYTDQAVSNPALQRTTRAGHYPANVSSGGNYPDSYKWWERSSYCYQLTVAPSSMSGLNKDNINAVASSGQPRRFNDLNTPTFKLGVVPAFCF